MCEYCQEYQMKYSHLELKKLIFAKCPFCGENLTVDEMWPSGHCSRSLCQRCYTQKFGHINQVCVVCGDDIQHKVSWQHANLRKISNHICSSPKCRGEWARIHASVTGLSRADAIVKMEEFSRIFRPEYDDLKPECRWRYGYPTF
jgi:hypothetical protein